MGLSVAFGKDSLRFTLPRGVNAHVFEPRYPPPLGDAPSAVARAINEPIGALPLGEIARHTSSAVIVVPDGTRPLPLNPILSPLLAAIGPFIPAEKTTILFATGMHRAVAAGEARRIVGENVPAGVRLLSHAPEEVAYVGETTRGVKVALNRAFLKADLRITVGLVEPHLLAGFSGGRKMIAPGIIGSEAMPILHGCELIGHPKSEAGRLAGNPFHEEIEEIARMTSVHFAVNATIDSDHNLTAVFAGDIFSSHLAAAKHYNDCSLMRAGRKWPVVITSGGGAPLDATFYQSVKGIVAALPVVSRGGTVLLAAAAERGWGSDSFTDMLTRFGTLDAFLRWAERPGAFRIDQWMVQHFLEAREECRMLFFSNHADAARSRSFGMEPVKSLDEGIRLAVERAGATDVAVMPRGPYTWVSAAEQEEEMSDAS